MRIRFEIMLFILAVGAILSKVMVGTQILPLYNKWSGEVIDQSPNKIAFFDRIPGVKMEMRFNELLMSAHLKFVGDETVLKSNNLPTSDIYCKIAHRVESGKSSKDRIYNLSSYPSDPSPYCTKIAIERPIDASYKSNIIVTLENIAVADMNFVGERGWIIDYLQSSNNNDHQGEGKDWLLSHLGGDK